MIDSHVKPSLGFFGAAVLLFIQLEFFRRNIMLLPGAVMPEGFLLLTLPDCP